MRHRKSGLKLNRTSAHRKALMRNLSLALLTHGTIRTTLPKAKELRRFIEPLITLAKVDSVANRRLAFARLHNKAGVGHLFATIAPLFMDRPGGYTRVLKAGYRAGDKAPMAYIQLVDMYTHNATLLATKETTNKETTNTNSATDGTPVTDTNNT